jgi:hypothetical protein
MITGYASVAAESAGVPIYVSVDIKAVSFVNSPYYAHAHLSAVDLYPSRCDDPIPSPVKGRVVGIRSVKAPHQKNFRADEDEKLLLIANNATATTKILHLNPTVRIGDSVDVSEPVGNYVRSGFFNFWTPNHIHVEIRPANDPIRASGSFPMVPKLLTNSKSFRSDKSDPGETRCEVISANPEFLLLRPLGSLFGLLGGHVGLAVLVDEQENAILDRGFPHYDRGEVLISDTLGVKPGNSVKIGDLSVGEIASRPPFDATRRCNYAPVEFNKKLEITFSGSLMRGLSYR